MKTLRKAVGPTPTAFLNVLALQYIGLMTKKVIGPIFFAKKRGFHYH